MFKKLMLFVLAIGSCITVAGCSSNQGGTNSSKLSTSLPKSVKVKSATPDVSRPPKNIILDDKILKSMEKYCSEYKYLEMTQNMISYSMLDDKVNEEKNVASVKVKADLDRQITNSEIKVGDQADKYYFADDNKKNIHISKVQGGTYVQNKKSTSSVNYNFNVVENSYDFIKDVSHGLIPSGGAIGVVTDNEVAFKTVREAKDSDISGTEYDKLGDTTITLTLDKDVDYRPISLCMDTTYYVGQDKYGVRTECTFDNFSDSHLSLPKYKSIKKVTSNSKKVTKAKKSVKKNSKSTHHNKNKSKKSSKH